MKASIDLAFAMDSADAFPYTHTHIKVVLPVPPPYVIDDFARQAHVANAATCCASTARTAQRDRVALRAQHGCVSLKKPADTAALPGLRGYDAHKPTHVLKRP